MVLTLAAAPLEGAQKADAVIARVGDEKITAAEFREVLIALRTSGDPGKLALTLSPEGQESILRELVDARLMARRAREKKLDTDPDVKRRIDIAVTSILLKELVDREVAALDLSEGRLRAYYESHKGTFRDSARVKARHIVTATRSEAEDALNKLRAGSDFAALAGTLNTDNTKNSSGDLGWVPRGYMVKEFEAALFALGQGQISGIVKTSFGYHIIKAEELAGEKIQPFAQAQDRIRKVIAEQRLSELREELKKNTTVTIDRDQLDKMIHE
jgi:peptidyl-prolyl cis-trans isomerase C